VSSGVDIRPISKEDHAEWHTLWTAYLKFNKSTLPDDNSETTWKNLSSPYNTDLRGFVARKNNKAIGLIHYYFRRSCSSIESAIVYVQDIYVSPDMHGSGTGQTLLKSVRDAANHQNYPRISWVSQEHTQAARKLYRRIATNQLPC